MSDTEKIVIHRDAPIVIVKYNRQGRAVEDTNATVLRRDGDTIYCATEHGIELRVLERFVTYQF